MLTAALFTTASTEKQPKCPSTDEWIKKMWCIYTVEYYPAVKKSEIGSFVEMWMGLRDCHTEEVRKIKIYMVYLYMWNLEKWYR